MALNLGDNLDDLVTAGAQVALQVVDDICCLHKGDRNEVDIHLNGKVNVYPVLQLTSTNLVKQFSPRLMSQLSVGCSSWCKKHDIAAGTATLMQLVQNASAVNVQIMQH